MELRKKSSCVSLLVKNMFSYLFIQFSIENAIYAVFKLNFVTSSTTFFFRESPRCRGDHADNIWDTLTPNTSQSLCRNRFFLKCTIFEKKKFWISFEFFSPPNNNPVYCRYSIGKLCIICTVRLTNYRAPKYKKNNVNDEFFLLKAFVNITNVLEHPIVELRVIYIPLK